jgi:hypothetical protein
MTNANRIKLERSIVVAVVDECAKDGFVPVSVYDGGEYVPAADAAAVLDAVFSVDEATIHFAPSDDKSDWGKRGVFIVLGNGEDCISDFHCGDASFARAVERASDRAQNATVSV